MSKRKTRRERIAELEALEAYDVLRRCVREKDWRGVQRWCAQLTQRAAAVLAAQPESEEG